MVGFWGHGPVVRCSCRGSVVWEAVASSEAPPNPVSTLLESLSKVWAKGSLLSKAVSGSPLPSLERTTLKWLIRSLSVWPLCWLQLNLEMFFLVAYLIIKFSSLFSISLIFFALRKGWCSPGSPQTYYTTGCPWASDPPASTPPAWGLCASSILSSPVDRTQGFMNAKQAP